MTTTRKPRQEPKKEQTFGSFKGFANIELSASAKATIIEQSKLPDALETALGALVESGYKVTFSYDNRSACIQCTATGTEKTGPSSGYATSARSDDYTRAAVACAVKVYDIADGDLSLYAKEKVNQAEI